MPVSLDDLAEEHFFSESGVFVFVYFKLVLVAHEKIVIQTLQHFEIFLRSRCHQILQTFEIIKIDLSIFVQHREILLGVVDCRPLKVVIELVDNVVFGSEDNVAVGTRQQVVVVQGQVEAQDVPLLLLQVD